MVGLVEDEDDLEDEDGGMVGFVEKDGFVDCDEEDGFKDPVAGGWGAGDTTGFAAATGAATEATAAAGATAAITRLHLHGRRLRCRQLGLRGRPRRRRLGSRRLCRRRLRHGFTALRSLHRRMNRHVSWFGRGFRLFPGNGSRPLWSSTRLLRRTLLTRFHHGLSRLLSRNRSLATSVLWDWIPRRFVSRI